MYLDLVDTTNTFSYNISIAQLLGLECSIYISALISAMRRIKVGEECIDRNYIYSVTTFSKDTQYEMDKKLAKFKLISIGRTKDKIIFDEQVYFSLLNNNNAEALKSVDIKVKKSRTKQDSAKDFIKEKILTQNPELRDAYKDWVDAVFAKQGWMSATSIEVGQSLVDTAAKHDLDKALEIVQIASIGAYRDMQWAVDAYNKHKGDSIRFNTVQSVPQSFNITEKF